MSQISGTSMQDRTPLLGPVNDDESPEKTEEILPPRSGSLPGSWINLANTILGAGMLGIPFAVDKAGLVGGLLLLAFCAFLAGFGLHLLGIAGAQFELARQGKGQHVSEFSKKTGVTFPHTRENPTATYFQFAKLTYPKARILIDAAIAIKCFGVSISYLIVVGDLMPEVMRFFAPDLGASNILRNRHFWIALSAIICVPLAFLPRLDMLKYTSVIALFSMLYLVAIIVSFFFLESDHHGEIRYLPVASADGMVGLFANLPIFVFAYTCHQNLPAIYNELPRAAGSRINGVVLMSVLTCLVAYYVIGIFGYLSFKDTVVSDIVKNYPENAFVSIGRMSLVLNVALSFPLQSHPARNSIDAILFPNYQNPEQKTKLRYYIETSVMCVAAYAIAFVVKDLGVVFSVIGATGSTTICYILPGSFYFKIAERDGLTVKRVAAAAMVCLGFAVMITSLTFIVLSLTGVVNTSVGG